MFMRSRVAFASMLLSLTLGTMARAACPEGQRVTADTAGQCCWPGQAWSRTRKACVGLPSSCPQGLTAQDERCARACPAGQLVTVDTQGQCCWPGQAYSNTRQSCIGVPTSCPPGLAAQGETCVTVCPPGQLVTEDTQGQCCWPGQVYTATRQRCIGLPSSCPAGFVVDAESCRPANAAPVVPPAAAAPTSPVAPPAVTFEPAPYQPGAAPATQPPPDAPPPLVSAAPPPGAPVSAAPQAPPQVPAAQPPRPMTKREQLAAQRAAARARRAREEEEAEKSPRRVRAGLVAGFFAGAGYGAGIGLPLRVALFRVKEQEPLQGTLALAIEPWLFGAVRSTVGVDYLSLGLELNLAIGWEQRLGPVELFPRVGLSNGLNLQAALGSGQSVALYYLLRGLLGLRFAAPAGERTKFLAGLDVHLGGEALWLAYVGVGF